MNKNKKKVLLCLGLSVLMALSCGLCACGPNEPEPDDKGKPIVTTPPNTDQPNTPVKPEYVPLTKIEYRDDFSPTKFNGDTVENTITELGQGAWLVTNTVMLNATTSGGAPRKAIVYAIEVDLNFANIVAGTKGNETTQFLWDHVTPYATATAWEQANQGGHVYASLNADFFNPATRGLSVNAFVKDGVIIKAAHNDQGIYDYKNADSDVPASAPMLFGVKGNKAQIAPIIQYEGDVTSAAVKENIIKAKLSYGVAELVINGVNCPYVINEEAPEEKGVSIITESGSYKYGMNTLIIKLDATGFKADTTGSYEMSVLEAEMNTQKGTLEVDEGEVYILAKKLSSTYDSIKRVAAGNKVNCEIAVTSPDGTWNGYTTILGSRQTLVLDGEVPATVALENTNGAQNKGIPRSGVGIKENGHVVIFTVEGLRYNKNNKVTADDPYGMNLPEFAEFMKFYGVEIGTNFDGGGSTQLICRGEKEETGKVYVRSSDTASSELTKTRVVVNSILVTNRPED